MPDKTSGPLEVVDPGASKNPSLISDFLGYGILPWVKYMATAMGFGVFLLPKYCATLGWGVGSAYLWLVGLLMMMLPFILEQAMSYVMKMRRLEKHAWTVRVSSGSNATFDFLEDDLLRSLHMPSSSKPVPVEVEIYTKIADCCSQLTCSRRRKEASTLTFHFVIAEEKDIFIRKIQSVSENPGAPPPFEELGEVTGISRLSPDDGIWNALRGAVIESTPPVEEEEGSGGPDDENPVEMADAFRPAGRKMVFIFRLFSTLLFFAEYVIFMHLINDCGLVEIVLGRYDTGGFAQFPADFQKTVNGIAKFKDETGKIVSVPTTGTRFDFDEKHKSKRFTIKYDKSGGQLGYSLQNVAETTDEESAIFWWKRNFVTVTMAFAQFFYFFWIHCKGKAFPRDWHKKGVVLGTGRCDDYSAIFAFVGCCLLSYGLLGMASTTETNLLPADLNWGLAKNNNLEPGLFLQENTGTADALGSLYKFFTLFTVAGLCVPVRGQILKHMSDNHEPDACRRAGRVNKIAFFSMLTVILSLFTTFIVVGHLTWGRGIESNVVSVIQATMSAEGMPFKDMTLVKIMSVGAGLNIIFSGVLINAEVFKETREIFHEAACCSEPGEKLSGSWLWDNFVAVLAIFTYTIVPVILACNFSYHDCELYAFTVCALTLPCLQGLFVLVALFSNARSLISKYQEDLQLSWSVRISSIYILVLCSFAISFGLYQAVTNFAAPHHEEHSDISFLSQQISQPEHE